MICPNCHMEIGEGKKFCGKCGTALSAATGPTSVPDMPGSLHCPKCGSEVSPGQKFCGACGSPVGRQQGQSPTASPKIITPTSSPVVAPRPLASPKPSHAPAAGRRKALIAGGVAVAVLLGAAAGWYFWSVKLRIGHEQTAGSAGLPGLHDSFEDFLQGTWTHRVSWPDGGKRDLVLTATRLPDGRLSFRYRQQYFSYDPVFENYSIEHEVLHLRFALKAYDTRADSQHRISYLLTRSGNGLSGQFAPSWEQPQQVSLTRIAERSQTQEEGTLPAPSSRPVPVTGNNAAQSVQTVTPTSDASTRVDCSSERSLRAGTGEATKIQFVNRSSQSIGIVWLNQNGARVLYKTLNSGESYLQDTFLTHPWVITNFAGECQAIYMPTRGTSTVEYQAPLAAKIARENESRPVTLFTSPAATIFYKDSGTDVLIDITGPDIASPMIKVDVNENGQIDPNLDTYYTVFRGGPSPCNGYLVNESAITGCGALVSKSTLEVNSSPAVKSFHWVIPKTELSTAGVGASLIVQLYDLKSKTRLSLPSESFSNSFRLTFVAAN